jgi:IS30 family transposase
MSRAKLSYDERVLIQDMKDAGSSRKEICETLGITSYELQQELELGWIGAEKRYSAEKAQFSLK